MRRLVLLGSIGLFWGSSSGGQTNLPQSLDPDLTIELIAAEPDIVTPVGVAVDTRRRVLVIESHTHFRPEGYQGPPADRLLQFEDQDGDGKFETRTVIFEGTRFTMNLAVEVDNSVLLATRREIFRLKRDQTGKVTDQQSLAHLDTKGDYPHNGLSGFAQDSDGSIYFGMGENLGADYKLIGADGRTLSGGGEGGNVFRVRYDGGGLVRFATGFWNPFHLAFDPFERLFAVDNDPDSRPPCRLLNVVEKGDYGYRFRNGRRGLHPFTAWNGELPGILPMAAGTGEAPSGLLVYESDQLPEKYRGQILATSWGDHQIEAYTLEAKGASVSATRNVIIQGGEQFRPVGIAQGAGGSVFVTDWVDRSYSVHGKGRLWRIKNRTPVARVQPTSNAEGLDHADSGIRDISARFLVGTEAGRNTLKSALTDPNSSPRKQAVALRTLLAYEPPESSAEIVRLGLSSKDIRIQAIAARHLPDGFPETDELTRSFVPGVRAGALRNLKTANRFEPFQDALKSTDPFLQLAARVGLEQSLTQDALAELTRNPDPVLKLQALLCLREVAPTARVTVLPSLLRQADPQIRLAALEWFVQEPWPELAPDLRAGINAGPLTDRLFGAYLLALAKLQASTEALEGERPDPKLCARLAFDGTLPETFRAMALRWVDPRSSELTPERLDTLLNSENQALRAGGMRVLLGRGTDEDIKRLAQLAVDVKQPLSLRADAVATLNPTVADQRKLLTDLAVNSLPVLGRQVARSLRGVELSTEERAMLERQGLLETAERGSDSADFLPQDSATLLARPGDPAEGERIFFHPKGPKCADCHQVAGRGKRIGPDLTGLGETTSEERLLQSILEPSREIAPQFTLWRVERQDGTSVEGLLEADRDDIQVYRQADGKTVVVPTKSVETRTPLTTSLMPHDLSRLMTPQELRDVISYLKTAGTVAN